MNRPWIIYSVFAACLLVVGGALAWVSVMVIEFDRRDAQAQRVTDLQESVRLALWRMDSALGPIIAQENARPWQEYKPYYNPSVAYDPAFNAIGPSGVQLPSPLLDNRSPLVKLYFQVDETGRVTSPQLPGPNEPWPNDDRARQQTLAQAKASLGVMMSVATPEMFWGKAPSWSSDFEPPVRLTLNETEPDARDDALPELPALASAQEKSSGFLYKGKAQGRDRNTEAQQELRNDAEWAQRQKIVEQGQYFSKVNRANAYDNNLPQQQAAQVETPPNPGASDPSVQALEPDELVQQRGQSQPIANNTVQSDSQTADVIEGPMEARWIGDELVLLRRVRIGDAERVQGVWLDWAAIQPWLLEEVSDLLPHASLVPAESSEDAARLATAPIRILPNEPDTKVYPLTAATTKSLIVAWGGALLALIAVSVLMRGTLALSERRAAFVSAVTHELRTPLTTFKMYTQMLADGMVPDESTRARYLTTLRTEADRLGHLVENVLTYARLERHRMTGRLERMPVDELIERVGDRLTQRCEQAEMELTIDVDASADGAWLETDSGVVEQVLFNLVDNACKYAPAPGRGDADPGGESHRIDLIVRNEGGRIAFAVVDHGPGVCPDAKATLFQPFTKSAQRAAVSAPGVGLGLALCRKLARRIGGDLVHDSRHTPGCRFVLQLPAV